MEPVRLPFIGALKPSVRQLQKDHVIHAYQRGGDDSLIMQELTRLVDAYLADSRSQGGGGLDSLLKRRPTCPIEEIALNIAISTQKVRQPEYI